MINQSPDHRRAIGRRRTLGPALRVYMSLCCCGAITVAGCGGSGSSESTVVPPPPPAVVETGPSDTEPPGGIVLPPGEIPSPTSVEAPKTDGGIEMPKGATVPVESASPEAGAATKRPQIQYGTWEEIQAAAKSSGRITVVDLWSLACEPCLEEFPGLVRLHESMGSSVRCIAVDLDFDGRKSRPPEHYEEQVAAFLESVGAAGFATYISRTPSEEVYAATKLASIPAVLVYDANGEIVKVFVDAGDSAGFSYEQDVIPLVTKLAG